MNAFSFIKIARSKHMPIVSQPFTSSSGEYKKYIMHNIHNGSERAQILETVYESYSNYEWIHNPSRDFFRNYRKKNKVKPDLKNW